MSVREPASVIPGARSDDSQPSAPVADIFAAEIPDFFHPLVRSWFTERFGAPTAPQNDGWPAIHAREDTLIAAPTGSGKTLAAFLVKIDELVHEALTGGLTDGTRVVYVSPLKALSNDVERNLTGPLAEIQALAAARGLEPPSIRVGLRTGDTTPADRRKLLRKPPHMLVTTPESLFLMLTAESSRETLREVDTVIIDEIHALARDKRGSHLVLSLQRLDALVAGPRPLRIGLSATQKPIEDIARFLTGVHPDAGQKALHTETPSAPAPASAGPPPTPSFTLRPCTIINSGHRRDLDLAVEVPDSELSAVCSNEQWEEIYGRLQELIDAHRSTLIFVNTRAMAERVSYYLCEHLGEAAVGSHHGSLSKETRLAAERKLKNGELRAIVATASLELGIDIGTIDLVCQIGSPRSIATFLQRVGRSGHAVGALPRGRLFALTRDELVESLALIGAVRAGRLDPVEVPRAPLDILAQQIVAAAAADEWNEDDLYQCLRGAAPYAALTRADYDEVVRMLARGYGDRRGKAYIHHDPLGGRIRGRKNARLAALTSGGAIPEQPQYRVVNVDDGTFVGTIHEDFAVERPAGTIFLLGNNSWQMINTRGLTVNVRDAHGAPPSMPFWFGEAPGRTFELSGAVSELRAGVAARLVLEDVTGDLGDMRDDMPLPYLDACAYLAQTIGATADDDPGQSWAILQTVHYIAVQKASLGLVPTQGRIVFERFFDQTGGMQLVVHAPFGTRINRGWGLALRKSFCRSFDFELQASADDEGIVLSLGENQSFQIEQLFRFVRPENVQALLEQAFLQVPFFRTRWQWNANRALAVLRNRAGKRVAPALQRMRGDDLLTAVFPASTQCFEHITGDIELPDHPLVRETMRDCLQEAADLERLRAVLADIQAGKIEMIARDTREPSPFAYERLNASPYAFLDDAGLLDRRARFLGQRRSLPIDELRDLARLDEAAIRRVARESWPLVRDADELHDVLQAFGVLPIPDAEEISAGAAGGDEATDYHETLFDPADWRDWFDELVLQGRAGLARVSLPETEGEGIPAAPRLRQFWFAAERVELVRALYPEARIEPRIELPERLRETWTSLEAREFVLGARLDLVPMLSPVALARDFVMPLNLVEAQLEALEAGGGIFRGYFRGDRETLWCDRRLLQRIHRLTLEGLRDAIRPVSVGDFLHYLARRHALYPSLRRRGREGLSAALMQLEGFEIAAGAIEAEILPGRVADYDPAWLDELTASGEWTYGRLIAPARDEEAGPLKTAMSRSAPVAFVLRENLEWLLPARDPETAVLSENATRLEACLQGFGAQFTGELRGRSGLDPAALDAALGELIRAGRVTADGFAALRPYLSPEVRRSDRIRRLGPRPPGRRGPVVRGGGRWALFPGPAGPLPEQDARERQERRLEGWAWLLLDRYGVLFYDLLTRERAAPAWSELRPVLRKLEAQGRVRGGRFIAGTAGEQFALPGVVDELRAARDAQRTGEWYVLSAADPLNLAGVLDDGARIGATRQTRIVYCDGRRVATESAGRVEFHVDLPAEQVAQIHEYFDLPRGLALPSG